MTLHTRRGFALLVVLVVLAAAALVVLMTITLGAAESTQVSLQQHRERALAVAEVGLERTTAYLELLLSQWEDLDRALDPSLDDVCTATTLDPSGDDHLPPFTDGTAVSLPGWGAEPRRFLRVPWPDARAPRGAYFVRVDDNDDDPGFAIPSATNNNPQRGCQEGTSPRPGRDCDRVVVVTVVGISPGLDFGAAQARKTLRVVVGRKELAGVVAGGEVQLKGDACGRWCDLEATGLLQAGALCSGCTSDCRPERVRAASRGASCERTTAGPCLTEVDLRPVPQVVPAAPAWRPGPCLDPSSCTPYFLVTPGPRVSMWDYGSSGCAEPRRAPLACSAGGCACWKDVTGSLVFEGAIYVDGQDPSLRRSSPAPAGHTPDPDDPTTWDRFGNRVFVSAPAGTGVCRGSGALAYAPDPDSPRAFPDGVWLLDVGRVFLAAPSGTPGCSRATLVVTGSVRVSGGRHAFAGARDQDAALVAGGDLVVSGGGALTSCATGAVVLAREQVQVRGSSLLDAPVVAANQEQCFSDAAGPALTVDADSLLAVTRTPLVSAAPLVVLSWSESTL